MANKKKLYSLSEIIPLLTEEQYKVNSGMIADGDFMQTQLAELREKIKAEGVSEQYQYGSKQTATMTTYLQVQKQYGVIIRHLSDLVSSSAAKTNTDELTEFLKK